MSVSRRRRLSGRSPCQVDIDPSRVIFGMVLQSEIATD
jgi:hypothetical protein